jgi:fluoroquinolone transport system permease protein
MIRRLRTMLAVDLLLLLRNGFAVGTLLLALCLIWRLRALPEGYRQAFLPIALLLNPFFAAFYGVGSLVFTERLDGAFAALSVTPLRPHEYLASKLAALVGLATLENLLIAACSRPGIDPLPLLLGSAAAGVLFTLFGFIAAAHTSPGRYHALLLVFLALLLLPLWPLLPLPHAPGWLFLLHPMAAPLALMRAATQPMPAWLWVYALGYAGLWSGAAFLACRSGFARLRVA